MLENVYIGICYRQKEHYCKMAEESYDFVLFTTLVMQSDMLICTRNRKNCVIISCHP